MTCEERYSPASAAESVYRRLVSILDHERYVRNVADRYRDIGPFWQKLAEIGGAEAAQAVKDILDGQAL